LLAGGYLAIGCFFSAINKNQVIAFVLSILACAVFAYSDDPSSQRFLSDILGGFLVRRISFVAQVAQFSFRKHFESMLMGVLWFKDISYFVLLIIGWLAACTIILEDRKAK
jgi:ABC-2 type transport system permease protein